jgi:hypothetical protein
MPINHTQRYIAAERLSDVAQEFAGVMNDLARMRGPHKGGLTPKEDAVIAKMQKDVEALMFKSSKLSQRLRHSAKVDWRGI